jgi:hypothetical protein
MTREPTLPGVNKPEGVRGRRAERLGAMTSYRRLDVKMQAWHHRLMAEPSRPSFTLRFGDKETHAALRIVAQEFGVSMNRLAEDLIASALRVVVLGVVEELSGTLAALQSYRGQGLEEDLAAFAHAEAAIDDPIVTRLHAPEVVDPFGVGAIFAKTVE